MKFKVQYDLPAKDGGLRNDVVIEAPDLNSAQYIAKRMYGNVRFIDLDQSQPNPPPSSRLKEKPIPKRNYRDSFSFDDDNDQGPLHSIGRSLAREHLGVIGESLPDRAINALILLVLGLPVVGLWMGLAIYRAYLLAPTMGFPPVTLCVGVGLVAFLVGWLVLYLCPVIILRMVGLVVFGGWIFLYIAGWHLDVDFIQNVFLKVVSTNTDATNIQKACVVVAGLVGAWITGNLGKVIRGI